MIKKNLYTAPEAELLVVQSEALICASGDVTIGGFEDDGVLNVPDLFGFTGMDSLF